MSFLSAFAIYFIIWWVTLFAVLPVGVRSQVEDGDVVPGTEGGAPVRPNLGYKALLTTAIATVIFAIFYYLTIVLDLDVNDLPRIVPDFSN